MGVQGLVNGGSKLGSKVTNESTIEDHTGLAAFFAKRHGKYDWDDSYQDSLIGVWQAMERHDPERGALSTVCAFTCRDSIQQGEGARSPAVSVTHKRRVRAKGELELAVCELTWELPDGDVAKSVECQQILDRLSESREGRALIMRGMGYTVQEIADEFGATHEWARLAVKRGRRTWSGFDI